MNDQGAPSPFAAASSEQVPVVPLTFGQILDRTYQLMRAHWRLFFGVAGVPAAAILLLFVAMMSFMVKIIGPQLAGKSSGIGAVAGPPAWFIAICLIGEPLLLLVYALYVPAAIFAAAQADRGVRVTFHEAYSAAWNRYGRYLWLMILYFLYMFVPIAVIAAVVGGSIVLRHHAAGMAPGSSFPFFLIPLLVLFYLCVLVYSILIMLRFAVAYPASLEEGLTAWAAFRRSAQLTRGAKGRIFLVILVVYAAVYAMQLVCLLVLAVFAALGVLVAMMAHVAVGSATFFVLVGLGVLGYLVVVVFYVMLCYSALSAALAVLYHDQRRREDGLAVAAAQAG